MFDFQFELVRPQNAIEFEFDDFCRHLEIAMTAGSSLIPASDPEEIGLIHIEEDGEQMKVSFTDCPMNRAMFAVKRSFNDPTKFMSFMWRFWALMDLVREDGLRPWCQPSNETEGAITIPSEVLDVARRMRLNKRGAFNVRNFRKLVAQSAM